MTPAQFDQEKNFAACYENLRNVMKLDYSIALNVFKCMHEYLSEGLNSAVEIDSAVTLPTNANFGASVKIDGAISFVVGVLAEKRIFHEIAESYEHFALDSIDEDFDAVSELLNVATGHVIVRIAAALDIEEELEPPRFGETEKLFGVIKLLVNIGTFYLYIGREEIFPVQ